MNRSFLVVFTILSLLFTTVPAHTIGLVKASGTIYIKADGSVEGTTYIVSSDNFTYVFAGDIGDPITVERSNIVIDGNGHTLIGSGSGTGLDVNGGFVGPVPVQVDNVTIRNLSIRYWDYGINLFNSKNDSIQGCQIRSNAYGVFLHSSVGYTNWVTISSNEIAENQVSGIFFAGASGNEVIGNNITQDWNGDYCIYLAPGASGNIIRGNTLSSWRTHSVYLAWIGNMFYHNNFMRDFPFHVFSPEFEGFNSFDNGVEGNYWKGYNGTDLDGDDIGDTPYNVDGWDKDNYPLMAPYVSPAQKRVLFQELLEQYTKLSADFNDLNSTNKNLRDQVTNLTAAFDSTTDQLASQIDLLEGEVYALNNTNISLSQSLASLQSQLNNLNSTLWSSIGLQQEHHVSLDNELKTVENVLVGLMAATIILAVILIAGTIYLARRKPKTKPET
jgi:parallel beta-helix repeat protein